MVERSSYIEDITLDFLFRAGMQYVSHFFYSRYRNVGPTLTKHGGEIGEVEATSEVCQTLIRCWAGRPNDVKSTLVPTLAQLQSTNMVVVRVLVRNFQNIMLS